MFSLPSLNRTLIGALSLSIAGVLPANAMGLFDFDPAPGGAYVSGFGGINFGNDYTFEGVQQPEAGAPGNAGGLASAFVDTSSSRTFGGAVGYQLPFKYWSVFQPRLEVEVANFRQNVESGSFNGGNQTFIGDISGTSILLNNYSDIIFSEDQVIVPYIGGGLGVVFVDANVQYFGAAANAPVFGLVDTDTALYGTIAAGLSFRFSPQLDLYTEARYNRATNVDVDRRFISGGADLFNASVEDNLNNVSVIGGVRFRF